METKAHHALVGFFVVFLAAAGGFFLLWLSQASINRDFKEFDVVFSGPVRGLSENSEVRFNGIQVGEVTELGLNPDDPTEVIARIRVDAATPVKVDSVAQLEPQGITGLSYLQISAGEPGSELLLRRMGDRPPRIFARQAQLDDLLAGGESVLENAQLALTRVSRLLDEENRERLGRILEDIELITDDLAENRTIVTELRAAVSRLDQAALDISEAAVGLEQFGATAETFLIEDVGPMVAETEAASIAVNQASTETYDALVAIRPGLEAFAQDGLDDLTLAASDLQRLIASLEQIVLELEEDPAGFIAAPRGEEVELPQ